MSTVWIRVAYGAVIAVLLAFTAIFGIAMASPGPKAPGDPGITFNQLSSNDDTSRSQNQLQQQIQRFYGDAASYRNALPKHQRNVFLAATGLGVLFVLIGLALPALMNYLRLGMVVGGLLSFIYAYNVFTAPIPKVAPESGSLLAFLGVGAPEPLDFAGRFTLFAVSFIGLILALFLGLWRLTEWGSGRRVAPAAARPARPASAMAAPAPIAATPVSAPMTVTAPAPGPAGSVSEWAPPVPGSTTVEIRSETEERITPPGE